MNKFKLLFNKHFWQFVAAVWWLYEHWDEVKLLYSIARKLAEQAQTFKKKSGAQKADWFKEQLKEWFDEQEIIKKFPPDYLVNFVRELAVSELRVNGNVSK